MSQEKKSAFTKLVEAAQILEERILADKITFEYSDFKYPEVVMDFASHIYPPDPVHIRLDIGTMFGFYLLTQNLLQQLRNLPFEIRAVFLYEALPSLNFWKEYLNKYDQDTLYLKEVRARIAAIERMAQNDVSCFYQTLLQQDFDEAVSYCINLANTVDRDFGRKFLIRLTEQIGVMKHGLPQGIAYLNDGTEKYYGVPIRLAGQRIEAIWTILIKKFANSSKDIPTPLFSMVKEMGAMDIAEIFGPFITSGRIPRMHEDEIFTRLLDLCQVDHEREIVRYQPFLKKIFDRDKATLPFTDQYIKHGMNRVKNSKFRTTLERNSVVYK
jgi:hypothetical protein